MEQQKPAAGAVAVARLCIRAVLQRPAAPPAACEAWTWGSARSPRAGCGVGVGSAGTPGLCLCVGATGKTAVPCAVLRSCAAGSGVPGGYPGGSKEPKYSWLQGRKPEPAQGGGGATVAMFVVGKWWLLSRGTSQLKRRDLHLIWAQGWGRNRGTWDRREPLASGHAAPSAGTSGGSRFPASCVCAVNK